MMKDLLAELGVRLPDLVAGFAGGVVNAFVFKRSTPVAVIGSVVVGALTASYLGEPTAKILSISIGTACFLVGVGGMALVQAILDQASKRIAAALGGNNANP